MSQWNGEFAFALRSLVLKDFKIRYRNMSLGVFWSLLNPLIMMGVLTFVFTGVFPKEDIPHYPVFVLCGLIPFNFFALTWSTGTSALLDNAQLIKRIPVAREIIPIASILSNCIHLAIHFCLLLVFVFGSGYGVHKHWIWIPYVWGLHVLFVTGMVMACSAVNVYVRDMRYVVESSNTILFWLVPIFYSFAVIPPHFADIYQINPIAAVVMATRNIFLDGAPPPASLLYKLSAVSFVIFAGGWLVFHRLKRRFYDYL
jgi:lipopolysaccharide transport system permease protein